MSNQNSRPTREVGITDHLWETYEDMARQMGSDRDALINQALFMFARLNGFIEVARKGQPEVAERATTPAPGIAKTAPPVPQSVTGGLPSLASYPSPLEDTPRPGPVPQRPSARAGEHFPANSLDNAHVRRELAERAREKTDEVGDLIDDIHLDMARDDEPVADAEPMDDEPMEELTGGVLLLTLDNAEPQTITKDRFVIGRGKHCDLMINSGKVSREHAAIVREGDDFFIEDLNSSNGTWFNKQKIKRRKIEDGDEYFICSERVRLSYA